MYLNKIFNLSIYCVISFIEFRGCITQKTNHSEHPFLVNNDLKTHQQIIVRRIRQKKNIAFIFQIGFYCCESFQYICLSSKSISKSHNSSMNEYIFSAGGN